MRDDREARSSGPIAGDATWRFLPVSPRSRCDVKSSHLVVAEAQHTYLLFRFKYSLSVSSAVSQRD